MTGASRNVCSYVCVCAGYSPHIEYQNNYSTSKGGTFLGSEDIWAEPHSFKGLLEGTGLDLQLKIELDFRLWLGGLALCQGLVGWQVLG